ncbi:MAG TPA: pentapeptide repeat-containing protein [Blastocatellia bacterium]|nr:pentapeptide repeat-containing protein [Blastocatellia bacterium]
MTDSALIRLLKQDVKRWNQWRSTNAGTEVSLPKVDLFRASLTGVNLSGAYLKGADLSGADLSESNLSRANLSEVKLTGANLSGANLSGTNLNWADLRWADLSWADLSKANLGLANLSEANLHKAILSEADLSGAELTKGNLSESNLSWSDLGLANLGEADLSKANLSEANLSGAVLSGANLSRANLYKVNLNWANLCGADLRGSSLRTAQLIRANLDEANLTDACLWETQRTEWSIRGVICEYVYWDEKRLEKTAYGSGDFEKLFAEITRILLFYKDGIEPLELAMLPGMIKFLQDCCPGCRLRLAAVHDDSGGTVVELAIVDSATVSSDDLRKLKVELEVTSKRFIERGRLARKEQEVQRFLEGKVELLNQTVALLVTTKPPHHPAEFYRRSEQERAEAQAASASESVPVSPENQPGPPLDLNVLARELSDLRQAMIARRDSSVRAVIALGRIAEAALAAEAKNGPLVLEHLKVAGRWPLDFAREIGRHLAAEAIKQSLGNK